MAYIRQELEARQGRQDNVRVYGPVGHAMEFCVGLSGADVPLSYRRISLDTTVLLRADVPLTPCGDLIFSVTYLTSQARRVAC